MVVMLHRERRRRERLASLTALAPILGASLKVGDVLERLREAVVVMKSGKRFTSDLVLVSAGRHGATDGLGLENAGVAADARGRIWVNEHFGTGVPGIYAVGDVIGAPALASTSSEQGRLASCYMFGCRGEKYPRALRVRHLRDPRNRVGGQPRDPAHEAGDPV